MAFIERVDIKDGKTLVTIKVSKDEYEFLESRKKVLLLIDDMDGALTTGTLGNSNRIMLPNRLLKKHKIDKLIKKAPARVFDINGDKFLLIKLYESKIGIPKFGEE